MRIKQVFVNMRLQYLNLVSDHGQLETEQFVKIMK